MKKQLRLLVLVSGLAMASIAATTADSASGHGSSSVPPGVPLTSGPKYDRNPVLLQDGPVTWLFFARSRNDCNRPLFNAGPCNPDNPGETVYDLYALRSFNQGLTWTGPVLVATNPDSPGPLPFQGRTIAAARTSDGWSYLFWASGGNGSSLRFYRKPPGSGTFTFVGERTDRSYFNVEAVAKGRYVYVFYEDGTYPLPPDGAHVHVSQFFSPFSSFSSWAPWSPVTGTLIKNIPKVIVDRLGVFRMTTVDASNGTDYIASSNFGYPGTTWTAPQVATPGVLCPSTECNWDPTLAQGRDGAYHLIYAPGTPDDRQRIDRKRSPTFSGLSGAPPMNVTTGQGAPDNPLRPYWDYWPEAASLCQGLVLFYTSERGFASNATGTGHIWKLVLEPSAHCDDDGEDDDDFDEDEERDDEDEDDDNDGKHDEEDEDDDNDGERDEEDEDDDNDRIHDDADSKSTREVQRSSGGTTAGGQYTDYSVEADATTLLLTGLVEAPNTEFVRVEIYDPLGLLVGVSPPALGRALIKIPVAVPGIYTVRVRNTGLTPVDYVVRLIRSVPW